MKTYHFALLFSLVFVIMAVILNFRAIPDKALIEEQQILDEAVDRSAWAAVSEAASRYTAEEGIDKDRLIEDYFQALFSNLGVEGSYLTQKQIRLCHPVMVVTDGDGMYVHYYRTLITADGESFIGAWSEKIYYTAVSGSTEGAGDLVLMFRQSSSDGKYIVKVIDTKNSFGGVSVTSFETGVYEADLAGYAAFTYPECPAFEAWVRNHMWAPSATAATALEEFDLMRNVAIAEKMEEYLNYYCNEFSNEVAFKNGVSYEFTIPAVQTDMVKGMSDVSLSVLFQGYPYNSPVITEKYNRFTFSNSQFVEKTYYYCDTANRVYHRGQCYELDAAVGGVTKRSTLPRVSTEEDAARLGCWACPVCGETTGAVEN